MARTRTWATAPGSVKAVAVLAVVLAVGGALEGIVAFTAHPTNAAAGVTELVLAVVFLALAALLVRGSRPARLVAAAGAVAYMVSPLLHRSIPLILRLAVVSMFIVFGAIVLYLLFIPEGSVDWFAED